MISSLIGRNCIVPLRRLTDGAEDEAIEHNESEDGNKYQGYRISYQHVVSRIGQMVPDLSGLDDGQKYLLGKILTQRLVEDRLIDRGHFGAQLKEAGNIEDDAEKRTHWRSITFDPGLLKLP